MPCQYVVKASLIWGKNNWALAANAPVPSFNCPIVLVMARMVSMNQYMCKLQSLNKLVSGPFSANKAVFVWLIY